jgi:hypothetical protein
MEKSSPPKPSVEFQIMGPTKGKVLSSEEFGQLRDRWGFNTLRHGTYRKRDQQGQAIAYLYDKYKRPEYAPLSLDQVKKNLQAAEYLTSIGMVHPATEWGIYQAGENDYRLFAVTRALQECDTTSQTPEGWEHLLIPQDIDPSEMSGLGFSEDVQSNPRSHILSWIRRLDPLYESWKGSSHPLFALLNTDEASQNDNWGWDSETGKLYPVDLEVLDFGNLQHAPEVDTWVDNQSTSEVSQPAGFYLSRLIKRVFPRGS